MRRRTRRQRQRGGTRRNNSRSVLGSPLKSCCTSPVTGFYRDGYCRTGPQDEGTHVVCAKMTSEFLDFTKSKGNDLSSVVQPGDKWCLCALRWLEAYKEGKAPPVFLESTDESALHYISKAALFSSKKLNR
jgi:uncharacterized protein (DUF2237 family)